MRAIAMAEFFTRAGELQRHWVEGRNVVFDYEHGLAVFDGMKWSFELGEGVRA